MANTALTFAGSMVATPSASTPQSAGIDLPASFAAMILPSATAAVDMSRTMGRLASLPGAAIDSGLVETPSLREP
ncbi:hypothetical protein D9M68_872380 [compost metagenome]